MKRNSPAETNYVNVGFEDKPGIRLSDFLDAPIHGAPDAEETQALAGAPGPMQ